MQKKYSAKLLKILYYSREQANQSLLLPSLETGYPTKQFKQTLLDMKKTAFVYQIPYLTSNQIGMERSAIVFTQTPLNNKYYDPSYTKFNTYLNPKIVKISNNTEEDYEQCTSILGIESKVERYSDIIVTYMNEEGNTKEEEMNGFKSRIFQQAVDLLCGKLPIKWNLSKGQNRINENFLKLQNVQILAKAVEEYNQCIKTFLENNQIPPEYADRSLEALNLPLEINNIRFSTKDQTIDPIEKKFIEQIETIQEELIDFIELNKLPARRQIKS